MNTLFARRVRLLVLEWYHVAVVIFIVTTVGYSLYLDSWEGGQFILSQIAGVVILVVSGFLWMVKKKEGGDFSLIFIWMARIVAGSTIYMVLLLPVLLCVFSGLIPNNWPVYLLLALFAGVLSDFGMNFGVGSDIR